MKRISFFTLTLMFSVFVSGQDMNTALNYANSERYEEAEQEFRNIIEKEPSNSIVYFHYGETILKDYLSDTVSKSINEYSAMASEAFMSGIKADSTNALNYVGLGMIVLLKESDTAKADMSFNKALSFMPKNKKKLQPEHAVIYTKLGTAQLLGTVNRHQLALQYLNKARDIAPLDPSVFMGLGDVHLALADGQNTIMNYKKAASLAPKSPLPKIRIGYIYLRVPNLNAARPYFEEARDIDSLFAPVYRELGELYTMAGMYDLAKINFEKFLNLSGNNIPAKVRYGNALFRAKDYENALIVIKEILAVDNSRNYLNRLAGYCSFDKKPSDPEKAAEYLKEFFKNSTPESIIPKDYLYYGRILYKLARNDSSYYAPAFENFSQALALQPGDANLISELAKNYYYARWYAEAVTMFNKKLEGNDNPSVTDLMFIGKSYYQLKEYDKADSVFNAIIAAEPGNIDAYMWVANTYVAKDTSEIGLAIPKFESLIEKIGNDKLKYQNEMISAYRYLGSHYLSQKEYSEAESWFSQMLVLNPENKELQLTSLKLMAYCRYYQKNYVKAREYYQKILDLEPENAEAQKAIKDLTKAINSQK